MQRGAPKRPPIRPLGCHFGSFGDRETQHEALWGAGGLRRQSPGVAKECVFQLFGARRRCRGLVGPVGGGLVGSPVIICVHVNYWQSHGIASHGRLHDRCTSLVLFRMVVVLMHAVVVLQSAVSERTDCSGHDGVHGDDGCS